MTHLMSHHKEEFLFIQLVDDRIPQDDAFRIHEARDVRIDLFRVDALVHLKDAASFNASLVSEGEDLLFEHLVFHGPEVVEQRGDPDRCNDDDEEQKRDRPDADVQPPSFRTLLECKIRKPEEQKTDDEADHQGLE